MTSIAEHLSAAKRDIANGDKSLRNAAEHVAAAVELGASQRDVAATVGKSAAWVNRLLLWRSSNFIASGPFADDHKAKKQRAAFSQAKPKLKAKKSEARAAPSPQIDKAELSAIRKLAFKVIDAGYRIVAQELHPDKGGSNEAMARLDRVKANLKTFIERE